MRRILFFILIAASGLAGAAEDKSAELSRLLDDGHLPALAYFLDSLGGNRSAAAADFAQTSPENPAWRAKEWAAFDTLLRGGKYDKNGDHLRRELAKLPGAQWHFVIRLDLERRELYRKLGWGPGGNLYENGGAAVGVKVAPRLCYERREALTRTMAPVQAESMFRNWRTEALTANMISVQDSRGLRDELYGGLHEAPCFVYDDGHTRVELAADAWADSFTPAYTWWYNFDKGTHDYLYKAGGRDWCSEEIQNKAVRAQIEARRAAEKLSAPKSATLDGVQGTAPF